MTLSAHSALFAWDARHGAVPIVGGYPTHARNSAADWLDQGGVLNTAIVNTPRFTWASLYGNPEAPTTRAVRRPVLQLERSAHNLISADFSAWTDGGTTVTPGQPDPANGAAASLLTATTAGNRSTVIGFTGDGTKAIALALRPGTAAITDLTLTDVTASVTRATLRITWNGTLAPSVVIAAGAGLALPPVAAAGGYWILGFVANSVVAAHTNALALLPASAGAGTIDAYNPCAEDAVTPSSLVALGASRSADDFSCGFAAAPQASVTYVRFVEQGALAEGTAIWYVGAATESVPLLRCFSNGSAYVFEHFNSASAAATLTAVPAIGDTVEFACVLYADGHARIIQSVNGAAVTSAVNATTQALAPAWSAPRFYLNARGTGFVGHADFAEARMVALADVVATTDQGIMDEMRGYRLSAAGDLL